MKLKSNGEKIFYPLGILNKCLGGLLVLLMLVLTVCLLYSRELFIVYIVSLTLCLYLCKFIFFPKPVCTVYPDRLAWEQIETMGGPVQKFSPVWPELEAFFLAERWVCCGRVHALKTILILVSKNGPVQEMENFCFLSAKDRRVLLTELKDRGLTELPFHTNNRVPNFLKKIWKYFPY